MFGQLYSGLPTWVLAVLTLGLVTHIGSGAVAILSGAGAMVVRKGGRLHHRLGTVFCLAMLSMAGAACLLAATAVVRGRSGQIANVFASGFATYLVATGWLTVRRRDAIVGRADIGACASVLAIAAVALVWLLPLSLDPATRGHGVPVAAPLILAVIATGLGILDIKVILAGGVTGASRVMRHLWRMCLGLFIATGSFFIGQQDDMPAFIQGSPILVLLGFAPLVAIFPWMFAVRRRRGRWATPVAAKRTRSGEASRYLLGDLVET